MRVRVKLAAGLLMLTPATALCAPADDAGGPAAGDMSSVVSAHGLRLPATFAGDLPCADCEAVRYHLDLWPDQVFHLRRVWVGPKNSVRDDLGRWQVDPGHNALVLRGGAEMPLQFEIKGANRLRLLDLRGQPIESSLPYELTSAGTLEPTPLSLLLGGEMRYLADAARFTECVTGRSYPMVMEEGFVDAERAYRAATPQPGTLLYVTFEGSIELRPKADGPGLEPSVVVRRFVNAWPGQRCERARANASLTNTYWRIVRLGGEPVGTTAGRREPHLVLQGEGERRRYRATVGCNQMMGGYTTEGETLTFAAGASTRMACPPPLDGLERRLGEALAKTVRWQVNASTLELFDATGAPVALFEAVYF